MLRPFLTEVGAAENIPIESEPGNAGVEKNFINQSFTKMNINFIATAVVLAVPTMAVAQTQATDTLSPVVLPNVEVLATRADEATPMACSLLTHEQIERDNTGLDLPFLLQTLPGVLGGRGGTAW